MQERMPPQNIEAEQSVLGAALLDKDAFDKIRDLLQSEDFYREAHKVIYKAIEQADAKGEADIVTVTEALRQMGKLEDVGGIPYITALTNIVPTASNISYHAKIVEEKALLRRLASTATNIASSAYEATEEIDVIVDKAEKSIMEVSNSQKGRDFVPINVIVKDTFDNISKMQQNKTHMTGLPTGFEDFNKVTAGLQPSDLILLAARPSMGKTALALNIAQYIAIRQDKPVAFFSLEMSQMQLVQRMLCSEANINSQKLKREELIDSEWSRLIDAADRMSRCSMFIDDTPGISVMELRAKARRLKMKEDVQLIIIDYLQLMQGSAGSSRSENRQQEISDISRSLKALARELDIPVIALSQLSRSVESRQVKKPMLSDLRESGSLEQDADLVLFLYREDYYNEDSEIKGLTELNIAKHRNGPVQTIKLFFDKEHTRFLEISDKHE